MRLLLIIIFLIPNIAYAGSLKMIGEKGKLSEANRTISVKMYDNYYEPSQIEVKKDEVIKFNAYKTSTRNDDDG